MEKKERISCFIFKLTRFLCLNQIESILQETLQAVGAKAMVVGHTPQPMGANWYNISLR